MSATQNLSFFDAEAALYDSAYDAATPAGHALRARLAVILAAIGERPGEVLDVGMGPGRLCAELARRGWAVSGVDRSGEMVARARARLPEAAERLIVGDITKLPYPAESFDAVVASGVIEYAEDRPAAIAELARVLRPGGRAVVTLPNVGALYVNWHRSVVHPGMRLLKRFRADGRPAPVRRRRPPHRGRFVAILEAAGLGVEGIRYTNYFALPWPLDALFPRLAIRLAERLERRPPALAPAVATQLVAACSKAAPGESGSEGPP